MNGFTVVINIILAVLIAVVIYFAWQTVRESRKATGALHEVTSALEQLLTVTGETTAAIGDTAAELATAAEAAQQTAPSPAPRDQAEYERQERALRDVEELAERIFWRAATACGYQAMTGWRCADQNYVVQALARVDVPLEACRRLAGGLGSAEAVMGAAREAQREAETELRKLRQQQPAESAA